MNIIFNKKFLITCLAFIFSSYSLADHHNDQHHGIESIANDWVTASYTGKNESIEIVKNNMAEDGVLVQSRYVGFGFTFNPEAKQMTVSRVTPDSPADGILQTGDTFIEVNGIKVTEESMTNGSLGFRGEPGAEVNAVIERENQTKKISFKRGIIRSEINKTQVLENMESGNTEEWAAKGFRIIETLSKHNIVYVLSHATQTDYQVDLDYKAYTLNRFVFNENGKVSELANLTEDRFILEQTGFKISR